MAKGFGSQKSPDFTQRQKAYFRLIKQLLNCAHGREMKILRKHAHLVDAGFVETLEMIAQIRFNQGDIRSAYFLRNLAHWLVEELELYRNEPSATANFIRPPAFLGEILWAMATPAAGIAQNKGNLQAVYSLLQANLDQLNDNFYEQFCSWVNLTFITSESKKEQLSLGLLLIDFCTLLWQFPLGKRAINLEIVITGLEAVAKIFIPDVVPEIWANIQLNLAPAYRNRIRGNRADNQEKAIAACNNALLIYTRDSFLQQWATLQNNLGLVYTDRITGDKAENIEKSIACYETALKFVNRAQLSELWGSLQNNLGNAYLVRIQGDEAQNLEKAIACYQVALQVRTRSASPYYWASSQNNLGSAYAQRILGNKQKNLEKAILAYINALEVYTLSDYPQRWAETKTSLGNTYYKTGQITEALDCLRAALQVFTPTNFPRYCITTGLSLGKTALAAGMKAEAFEGYAIAIEAVEQSRLWGGISQEQEILAYTEMVVFCITNGERDKAREYAERSGFQQVLNLLDNNEFQQIYSNLQFLGQVLQATAENNGESQAVYQILENNLNKLDEQFVQHLQKLEDVFGHIPSGQSLQIATTILSFSNLIREFPQGDKAINLRIATTGYEVAATIYTKKDFPEQWGNIQDAIRELFQIQLFEAVFKNLDKNLENPKAVVYPLLEANKYKLDERFATVLRLKTEAMLSEISPKYAKDIAASLLGLSLLIKEFRHGNEANNLEIAITGYEIASKILTCEALPEAWGMCQFMLGNAYHRRIKGEQAENLEQSLSYLHNALKVCNREQFPELWAEIYSNLAIVYGYRIRGDQVENAELAIKAGEAAMQVFTRDQSPEGWGKIQNNLGIVYRDRILGDKAENLEKAIACYQNALSIRTREDFPELWAQTQMNLASAYRHRLKGDAAENVEKAIAANQGALQVYTKAAFPQGWAEVHMNLANAYLHRIHGDRSENLEKAIAAHQSALQVLSKEEYPRQWAMTAIEAHNKIIADLEADKQQIWEQMRRLDPVLAGQIQVSPMNLSSIQQLIDLPTTAILNFYTTSNDTHIFIIRQSQITLHTCTNLGFETLQSSILTHWLGQYLNNQDSWKEQFSFLIAELAEVLKLNDLIAQHLKNIDELILIPHLALHQIPFAALPIGENQYLGDKFLIRYVPSCQILEFCHNRPTVSSLMNYGIVEDATEDLPYASWEGEQLANLYNIPNNQRLKGSQEASVSNYRQLIQKLQVIHSSHHARSRLDNPLESALFLGDGCITLSQLLTPSWRNPQLEDVFLSCCETGLSVTEITDDILTFSTAFLCAGAKSVISTLWAVNDLATALFSVFYYQSRHQGNKRLQSIRQAQFELRTLTSETLTTIYKPKLSSFLMQKAKETDTLRKKTQKERDIHPHSSLLYKQCDEEYKKYTLYFTQPD
ncbi:MAG: tetratricopeptide repeat protein [Aulosira sp. DedQUE10]|nr:tetratricopeptide repeat protein [Aulosira sp. DedQUE10]